MKKGQYKGGSYINYQQYEADQAKKARIKAQIIKVNQLKSETKSASQTLSKLMKEYFKVE